MRLSYEPLEAPAVSGASSSVALLGMEVVRACGHFPVVRHVFDVDEEAGLFVELDVLGGIEAYAVGYSFNGDESLVVI